MHVGMMHTTLWTFTQTLFLGLLQDDMKCAEDYVRYCCQFLLERCLPDLQFMESMIDKTCIERLKHVASQPFARCSYTEAIEILQKAVAEGRQFVEKVGLGRE
jgi:asparaginyl-tRNA synthetase